MIIDNIKEALKKEFKGEQGFKYSVPFENAEFYRICLGHMESHLASGHVADAVYFRWFQDLAFLHFEYSVYMLYSSNEKVKSLEHLSAFSSYGELIIRDGSQSCNCLEGMAPYIVSNKAVLIVATFLLFDQKENFSMGSQYLIDSLNGKNCIIKKGYNKATISWFVLKLFSLYTQEEITLHPLLQPKLEQAYVDALEHWDTTDMYQLQLMVETLCELHLAQATLDLADAEEYGVDDIHNLRYRELFMPALYAFPYEILTWLKLRELKGIKNPKSFTHPLMKTPIVKMFLDIKEPLPKPTELPYAKELLGKLQEQCPNVEIPEWLEGIDEETPAYQQSDNILPADFMK